MTTKKTKKVYLLFICLFSFAEVELESDQSSVHSGIEIKDMSAFDLVAEDVEISFKDDLQFFEDTVPRHLKNKKNRQKKRKERKERAEGKKIEFKLSQSIFYSKNVFLYFLNYFRSSCK